MITEEHRAFAHELVALARRHGVNHLSMEFDLGSSKKFHGDSLGRHIWEKITLRWSEGRHGDRSNIALETRAMESIDEQKE